MTNTRQDPRHLEGCERDLWAGECPCNVTAQQAEITTTCTCGSIIGKINSTATRTCSSCRRVWDWDRLLQLIAARKAGH